MRKVHHSLFIHRCRSHDRHELGSRGAPDTVRAFRDKLARVAEPGMAIRGAGNGCKIVLDTIAVHHDGGGILRAGENIQ